jgi:hypothetical protein
MQTEPTPPAFQEGINDPEGWANLCREISDFTPKNALKKRAPKYSTTVSLNYMDGTQAREIVAMRATNPDDVTDLAVLFASLPPKPGTRRVVIISPANQPAYEF